MAPQSLYESGAEASELGFRIMTKFIFWGVEINKVVLHLFTFSLRKLELLDCQHVVRGDSGN